DGEVVQIELARDLGELLKRGAVEADPRDSVTRVAGLGDVRQIVGLDDPMAVAIDGAVDDHARQPISPGTPRASSTRIAGRNARRRAMPLRRAPRARRSVPRRAIRSSTRRCRRTAAL